MGVLIGGWWPITMDVIELERFSLSSPLGIGANYEVYAAVDRETGKDVVLKRPWAQTIRTGQSRHIDEQSARVIELHRSLAGVVPHIAPLVGYTERMRHDRYFGDALTQDYYVLVEERARGVPLVADIKDKFRGVPIGLAQNLFALYPLVPGALAGTARIFEQILDVEEAFTRLDHLIMDLRPQNVFFDPQRGEITIIDIGTSVDLRTAPGPRPTPDMHDCLAELCKFYLEPQSPPAQLKGYRDPYGMGPALGFAKELERMIQACTGLASGPLRDLAVEMLQRLQRRDYGAVAPFRRDLQQYFALVDKRNRDLQHFSDLVEVWRQGMELLREQYWRKYRFDPDADLAPYA
jgi:serine/threonine protein kinase